jgi:hypothetical protein
MALLSPGPYARSGKVWQTARMTDAPAVPWDDVYKLWAYECNQSDRETAERCGIPRRTIAYHRVSERWADRYIHDHYGLSEADLNLARIDLRGLLKEGIRERLRSVILDKVPATTLLGEPILSEDGTPIMRWRASDKDAVNAMRIVTQYTLDPARGADLSTEPLPAAFRVLDPEQDLSPQEQAIAILEDNAAAANTRVRSRRDGYT